MSTEAELARLIDDLQSGLDKIRAVVAERSARKAAAPRGEVAPAAPRAEGPDPLLSGQVDRRPPLFESGRWDGRTANGLYEITLRIDRAGSNRLSGDLFCREGEERTWCLGFATMPQGRLSPADDHWLVCLTVKAQNGGIVAAGTATIALLAVSSGKALATFRANRPLPSLPTGSALSFDIDRVSDALRSLRTVLAGVPVPSGHRSMAFIDGLRRAGITLDVTARADLVPSAEGWAEAAIVDHALETAAASVKQFQENRADLMIIWPERPSRERIGAIRFPVHAALPISIAAGFDSGGTERAQGARATLHSIGALLGLCPRSISDPAVPMDRRVMLDPALAYGSESFDFDNHEIAFLAHAPLPLLGRIGWCQAFGPDAVVVPSTNRRPAPYGGGAYDEEWPSAITQSRCTTVPPGLRLLVGGAEAGPDLSLGQPLFLSIALQNDTPMSVPFDPTLLDLKRGAVDIRIRRLGWTYTQSLPQPFRSVVRRAYTPAPELAVLPSGATSPANNLQVGYGLDGFIFSEPGLYEVVLSLDLPTPEGIWVVHAAPYRCFVSEPTGRVNVEDVLALLHPAAGFWLSLGGAKHLADVGSALEQRIEERLARGTSDGVAASVMRAAAIGAGRRYVGVDRSETQRALERSLKLFEKLDEGLLTFFDAHTRETTRQLRQRRADLAKKNGNEEQTTPQAGEKVRRPRRKPR